MKKTFKTILLSGCITVFSATAAYALPADMGSIEPALQAPYSEDVANMQREVDRFLFEEHASELEAKGIFVTHTSPNGEVVEIGIADYNEADAEYIKEQLSDYDIVVVEGERAYTLLDLPSTLPADTPVSSTDLPVTLPAIEPSDNRLQDEMDRNAVQQMQAEIDQFLFEKHATELEARGIHVTHTAPQANHVEIGLAQYDEEAVQYLTKQLDGYDVQIVQGEQAYTLGEEDVVSTVSAEVDTASEAIDAGAKDNKGAAITIIAGAVAALLAFILFGAYKSKARKSE